MTKIINGEDILKHPFTRCVLDAFAHLPFVAEIQRTNNWRVLFDGYSLGDFADGDMSFEEYFVRNLFKKVANVQVPGVDPLANTMDKFVSFLDSQENDHFRVEHLLNIIDDTTQIGRVLLNTRAIFHSVFDGFNDFHIKPRYTAGSTLSLTKIEGVSPFNRFKASEGSQHLRAVFKKRWEEEQVYRFSFTERAFPQSEGTHDFYVKLMCVPKQWNILRIIGKGPSSVLACQAGLGDWMTYRAKARCGLDITQAQHKHRHLARMASLTDSYLMTADQSEASDRILRVLIAWLMPSDVFKYMEDISPSVIELPDGTRRHTRMMAPAGNGYIFPLQTILFWALTKSVCQELGVKAEVYSYGDDLIAPAAVYTRLEKLFNVLTLKMNPNKTFRSGSARESCGGDYVLGSDVRPLYVNNIPTNSVEWYSVLNGIRRVGFDNNLGYWRTNNFRRLWLWCIAHIPKTDRLFAPIHYGDTAIGTGDTRLYRISYKRKYYADGKSHHYPNGGIREGVPYSGWYITINVTRSAGKGETYPEHTKGIKQVDLLRLTSLRSCQGSGSPIVKTFTKDRQGNLLDTPLTKYVYKPFYLLDELVIQKMTVPLILECPAPSDNVDDLFAHLDADNPICDTDSIIFRCNQRHNGCVVKLIELLRERVSSLEALHVAVEDMDLNF